MLPLSKSIPTFRIEPNFESISALKLRVNLDGVSNWFKQFQAALWLADETVVMLVKNVGEKKYVGEEFR